MGLIKLLTDPGQFKFYKAKGYQYKPREVPYGNDRPGGGSSDAPLVTTPLPSVESSPTAKTTPDSLYRGQGVVTKAVLDDTKRISKFLLTDQGLEFLATQQALLITENIRMYGNNVSKWRYINPASYIENTSLAATGVHVKNTFQFGLKPVHSRENTFLESNPGLAKRSKQPVMGTDRITTSPMYIAKQADDYLKDTVNFYITKVNNDGSGDNTYIHFRSYIKGLSDNYGADWKSTRYMGRGEDFFMYNGFSRDISFDFQVPILSRLEQASVYSKLNYLASLMAPDYTAGGFMRGNIVKITLGDYLIDVPGILTGISFDMEEAAGWDIGEYNDAGVKQDGSYVMPKLINVGGFKFKPIHTFIPQTVQEKYITSGKGTDVNSPFISFGKSGDVSNNNGGYDVDEIATNYKIAAAQREIEALSRAAQAATQAAQ